MSEVGNGWQEVALSDHVYIAGRIGWRGLKAQEYVDSGPILLSVPNLNHGDHVNFDKVNHITQDRYDESPEIKLQVGDTLLVKDGAGIGKIGYVDHLPGPATVNSSLLVVRPATDLLDSKFLFYFFKTPAFQNVAKEKITGSATPHLFQKDIKRFRIPLPPLDQQRRIVAKLEALLARVNAARERLDKIPILLKRFRQAVLTAACTGQLTSDWRERNHASHNINYVVSTIHARREAAATTPTQKARLQQIYWEPEESDNGVLPPSWGFVKLKKLCRSFDYGTSARSTAAGKVPVLRMGNIQDGEIDWTDLVYTSNPQEINAYNLQPNTVLFNRTNSPELVGKTAIYRGERPAIFAGYLVRANPEPELLPEYLNLCLNTPRAKAYCQRVKSDGVSQSNINAQKLASYEVPFCSIDEQREIVRRAKDLSVLATQLGSSFASAQSWVERIGSSILSNAFCSDSKT